MNTLACPPKRYWCQVEVFSVCRGQAALAERMAWLETASASQYSGASAGHEEGL